MLDMEQRFVFLGSQKGLFKEPLPPRVSLCHDRAELEAAVAHPTKRMTMDLVYPGVYRNSAGKDAGRPAPIFVDRI